MARKLSTNKKRWLLSAHILLSAPWLGTAVCFLVLIVATRNTTDGILLLGTYKIIDLLDGVLVRPLAIGTAATGVLLAVLTPRGLSRFDWIAAKLVLTVVLIISGVAVFGVSRAPRSLISLTSAAGLQASQNPSYQMSQTLLLTYVAAEVAFLSAAVAISVFKPRPRRGREYALDAQGVN